MKKALVIGATGAVGKKLVEVLLNDEEYDYVHVFVRNSMHINHPKLIEQKVDFDHPENWHFDLNGDVLFCCMGTTLRQAGSKAAQYKVDYTYQFETAKAAAENGVRRLVLLSSAGASATSFFFYPRIKGQLENGMKMLEYENISIVQPSFIEAFRKEERRGERAAISVAKWLGRIGLLKRYAPVTSATVARAMVVAARKQGTKRIQYFTLDKVSEIADYEQFTKN
jgi:uncharacterized protein YbjT (DUF2867 family)